MNSGVASSSFEVFRGPVKDYLKKAITDLGHNPIPLDPILEKAIDRAIEEVETAVRESRAVMRQERFIRGDIEETSLTYVKAVLSQHKKMNRLKELIRSYGSVFIVGAGVSFESGMPLTSHLKELLRFCKLKEDFSDLPTDQEKSHKFKIQFKKLTDGRLPTASHITIAGHLGIEILEVIALNWDDLIERAGIMISIPTRKVVEEVDVVPPGSYLWKPHGDVENIKKENKVGEGGWVFPYESGYIFNCFVKYINAPGGINSRMFVLVIAGYGEEDKTISEKVIGVLAPDRTVFRIVLDLQLLQSEYHIVGPSDYVLPNLFV